MKTRLLSAVLIAVTLFLNAQSFDNIPTGTGYYINKLITSPSGPDLTNEYLEIRGTANEIVPSDLYLISIEGDGNSSSLGQVEEAIQLGDGVRTFGSNGILVVVTNYTETDAGNAFTPSPYDGLIDDEATVILIALEGTDVTSSSSSAVDTKTPDIGYDGNFIDATGNYMLISAASNPKDVYIDGTGNDDADGDIDASGDHTTWTLYDSITYMDDNDEGQGEYGYGQIIYAQQNGLNSANQFTTTSANVVNFDSGSDANYLLRQGTKTGYTADDWIVAGNGSGDSPNWEFSSSSEKVYPDAFVGWTDLNQYYGKINPSAEALSTNAFTADLISVYPNPAHDTISISAVDQESINSIRLYDVLGKLILDAKGSNTIDVSKFKGGLYLLEISTDNNRKITKKIIIE